MKEINRLHKYYNETVVPAIMKELNYTNVNQVPKIEKIVVNRSLGDVKDNEVLDKLISIALPRVRDFQGVSSKSFDGKGNYALGLTEQLVFPEISFEKIDKVRGLDIVIVTSTKNDEEAKLVLTKLGMPFKK